MIVLAQSRTGQLVHISEAKRGRACNCQCIRCAGTMLARKGLILAHHFAHAAGESCNAGETLAHIFAKKVIEAAGGLYLPSIDKYGELGKFVELDPIAIEPLVDGFRPDVVGRKHGVPLLIEIKVTAGIRPDKQAWLQDRGYSCIEIDLTKRRHQPNSEIEASVISTAPRRWVSHRNRAIPKPEPELGAIASCGGGARAGRTISNAGWYQEQTRKEFPDLDEDWARLRARLAPKDAPKG